jgi:hypothetical protein
MLFTLAVVMAGIVLLVAVVNNRREPSWWDSQLPRRKGRRARDGSAWAFGGDSGGDSGGHCGGDAGAAMGVVEPSGLPTPPPRTACVTPVDAVP